MTTYYGNHQYYDVTDGKSSVCHEDGDVRVNTDGARFVSFKGTWHAESAPPYWTEPSTCRGILRSLKEAAAKREPSKPLVDAMERATIALLDYDKALGETEQFGWSRDEPFKNMASSLVFELSEAVDIGISFALVSSRCHHALNATQLAVEAIAKAAESP